MNELSLFSGAGGGLLGSKLLGWRTIGYVEYDDYCQKVLAQRIKDGILDNAPIFGDIRAFIDQGYATSYQGMVDVITGGFPCQPFSQAGRKCGEDDERNMWPETIKCIRLVRPRFAFLENVPGILSSGYFDRILSDLAESGYDARWTCLGADDIGANHRRKRLWILAYAKSGGERIISKRSGPEGQGTFNADGGRENLGDSFRSGRSGQSRWRAGAESSDGYSELEKGNVADATRRIRQREAQRKAGHTTFGGEDVSNPNSERLSHRRQAKKSPRTEYETHTDVKRCGDSWWSTEPDVGRVAHGVAHRVDRLKAIGNGQVPLCMAYAFSILSSGIIE